MSALHNEHRSKIMGQELGIARSARALTLLTLILGVTLLLFSNFLYVKRIASFRFVDEYTNMVVGYLMQSGRVLYQQIFFHHHPLPVIVSSLVQHVVPVHSLYELVKVHRYLALGFSVTGALILLTRFRMKALVLVTMYEVLKYYFFGYQYLAESFIAYPIAYMALLIFETESRGERVRMREVVCACVLAWWIVFQREPYTPLSVFMALWIVYRASTRRARIAGVTIFALLSGVTLASLAIPEYLRQIFQLNSMYAAKEVGGSLTPFVQGITYLVGYIVTGLQTGHILYIALGCASMAALGVGLSLCIRKRWVLCAVICTLLILAGIRNPGLGSLWYNMYRAIPHIVVVLCIGSYFAPRFLRFALIVSLAIGMLIVPSSHFKEHRDNANEFYINYSETDGISQVISTLCEGTPCKLHVDGEDSLVYWQTKLDPWFQYGVFYNVQEGYLDYAAKRRAQFALSPPDVFYRTECMIRPEYLLTVRQDHRFVPLIKGGKTSCIWITKDLASQITTSQRESIAKHGYSLLIE